MSNRATPNPTHRPFTAATTDSAASMFKVQGLPLGLQLLGFEQEDADLIAVASAVDAAA